MKRNPLNKRLKREFKCNFGRYISIFIMLTTAIMLVSSFLTVAECAKSAYYDGKDKYNCESGQFTCKEKISDDLLDSLNDDSLITCENFYFESNIQNETVLRVFKNRTELNQVGVFEGKLPSEDNEIALDRLYAENNSFKIGDTIEIQNTKLEVCGLVALSDYSALFKNNSNLMMDANNFGVSVITDNCFENISNGVTYCYSYRFSDDSMSDLQKLDMHKSVVTKLTDNGVTPIGFMTAEENQSISFVKDDMGSDVPMVITLHIIILVIMSFVFTVLIRSTIEQESAIIGTLMASGFSKFEILFHYMKLPVYVTAIGAAIGNLLSYTVMIKPMKTMYYGFFSLVPMELRFNLSAFLLTTVLPISIMLIINFFTLLLKLSYSPLRFLRKDFKKQNGRNAVKLPHFRFINRFRIRVIIQNKSNYIMMFFGIYLSASILTFGLCIDPMISNYIDKISSNSIAPYQYILNSPHDTDDDTAERFTLSALNYYFERTEKNIEISLYGVNSDTVYLDTMDFTDKKTVYASEDLLKKFKYNVGDTIVLDNPYTTEKQSFKITGKYSSPGILALYMPRSVLNSIFDYDDNYYNAYFSENALSFDATSVRRVITTDDMTDFGNQMLSSFVGLVPYVIALSAVFFFILIYVLTKIVIDKNATSISYMKVFGYKPQEVRRLYLTATTIAVITSLLISLPLAYFTIKFAFSIVLVRVNGYIAFYSTPIMYLGVILCGIVTYLLVNAVQVRHINKIELTEALKNRE